MNYIGVRFDMRRYKFMLNRIAFTTQFGEKKIVVPGKGIWEITREMLKIAIKIARQERLLDEIEKWFCISFDKATLDDMEKPIYAGIAAALILTVSWPLLSKLNFLKLSEKVFSESIFQKHYIPMRGDILVSTARD